MPLDYLRITKDQQLLNLKKLELIESGLIAADDAPVGEFQIPEHLRLKRSDTEKIKQQKKKKVKALKYSHKVKVQEVESKAR